MDMLREILLDAGLEIIWFDSLGAKSSCIAIHVDWNNCILIDPGAAAMQPSYPLPREEKIILRRKAVYRIRSVARRCSTIIITHYHYDHHILLSDRDLENENIYAGKKLYIKDPNKYINYSQWRRSRLFLEQILNTQGLRLDDFYVKPWQKKFPDPVDDLRYIHERNYGDYMARRRELLLKGKKWFHKLVDYWRKNPWIRDNIVLPDNTRIFLGDGRKVQMGGAYVEIYPPWFHGVEYDKTGWVTPLYIVNRGYKIFYTSDLMGPIIEDYAYHISDLSPDLVIVDGPPTYLYPYMFNKINLDRAIDNMIKIIDSKPEIIIYDHHLLRDANWRKHVKKVIDYAKANKVALITAAEAIGEKPLIDKIVEQKHISD
ncbi:hypothetical protein Smar_1571 [Staphylothermus marinus F1]|uniref:UPF0282 protein Smar_1571 n=2 Tax=Staphylothermus marinus TaxID=2280 RepID=A3DPU5_STAMF|nr:hypothetical protein Smar_1571 [Staphylothermus marinus F1]